MNGIAGIVHPHTYQDNYIINSMLRTMDSSPPITITHANKISLGTTDKTNIYTNTRKSATLIFDGKINNITEIQQQLNETGYQLSSQNTAETLLCAYDAWDVEFIEKLNGSFAIVIVDIINDKIILIRDRIGEKNLYWFYNHNFFLFASDIKSLLATGLIPQTPSSDGLASYLTLGYIPQDISSIKNVNKLLPAYYLQYNINDIKLTIRSYWSYSSYFQSNANLTPSSQAILDNLASAVNLRTKNLDVAYTVEDDTPGSIISHKLLQDTLPTEELHCNDDKINDVVNDFLVKIIWHLGEPVVNFDLIEWWKLYQKAAPTVKDIFVNDGIDIVFGACQRYFDPILSRSRKIQHWRPPLPRWLMRVMQVLNKKMAFKIIRSAYTSYHQISYLSNIAIFDSRELRQVAPSLADFFNIPSFIQKFHHLQFCQYDFIKPSYFDVKTTLVDKIIAPNNALASAFDITLSRPFMDHHVIEQLAMIHGQQESILEELPLKAIMKQINPDYELTMDKLTTLEPPAWLSSNSIYEMFKLLPKGFLVKTGLISEKWLSNTLIQSIIKPHYFIQLWSILCLEIWYRLFIHNPINYTPPSISVLELLNEK